MNGRNYREAVRLHQPQVCEAHIRAVFQAYQDKGIRFVRDGGDFLRVSETAKKIAPEYGIDYRTPLYAIHKKGRYGGIVGLAYETMQEYRRLVEDVQQKNGDFIKIMASGIMDFANGGALSEAPLPEAEIREMISIAHAYGLAVMVHANGAEAVRNAALAGADSIEHGNEADGDSLDAMAAMGTVWVPTLATVCNLKGCGRYPEETLQKLEDRAGRNLCAAWEKGVHLALGSDAGAYRVPHGQGLLDEYEIFQRLLGAGEAFDRRLAEGEALIARRFNRQEKHPAACGTERQEAYPAARGTGRQEKHPAARGTGRQEEYSVACRCDRMVEKEERCRK